MDSMSLKDAKMLYESFMCKLESFKPHFGFGIIYSSIMLRFAFVLPCAIYKRGGDPFWSINCDLSLLYNLTHLLDSQIHYLSFIRDDLCSVLFQCQLPEVFLLIYESIWSSLRPLVDLVQYFFILQCKLLWNLLYWEKSVNIISRSTLIANHFLGGSLYTFYLMHVISTRVCITWCWRSAYHHMPDLLSCNGRGNVPDGSSGVCGGAVPQLFFLAITYDRIKIFKLCLFHWILHEIT